MGKIAYLDCPSGIAGDMCLGALLDAGVPLADLEAGLAKLGLTAEYGLKVHSVHRCGQVATQLTVQLLAEMHPRHLPEIERLILGAALPQRVTDWSLAIFHQLAIAEAAVHGIPPEQVHFHEVGATDAIVDIVGTCLGLDWLGIEAIYCSALPTGGGTVWATHGQLPVPAPAVLKLMALAQVPIYSNGIDKELVTPTGAAIATTLAQRFGPPPPMRLQRVGLGAGGRELPVSNILRLWLGSAEAGHHESGHHPNELHAPEAAGERDGFADQPEAIYELQTQLDDLSPQAIGYVYERLFAAGALDVFTQAIGMKKNRPGTLLTVLCPSQVIAACEMVLFSETTTLGVRRTHQQRRILHRDQVEISTPYGAVRIKVARHVPTGPIVNLQPEYEDCVQLARTLSLPWKQIHQTALSCAYRRFLPQAITAEFSKSGDGETLGAR